MMHEMHEEHAENEEHDGHGEMPCMRSLRVEGSEKNMRSHVCMRNEEHEVNVGSEHEEEEGQ
jgi:hypothetical protein